MSVVVELAKGVECYQGDALEVLRTLPSESVNCVVTSPPYWGLRDYGIPPSVWPTKMSQGVVRCSNGDHLWEDFIQPAANGIVNGAMSGETLSGNSATRRPKLSAFCQLCGAWRGCLGLEPTPELFVEHMVAVFRELRRVLRADGTLWVNMGDSYAATRSYQVTDNKHVDVGNNQGSTVPPGMKPKDLCGIPWMLAFALRADGWYLRSDIIWHKPNPMPESVTDRPTKSHEYIFLLSKSERYHYDADAIREPLAESSVQRLSQNVAAQIGSTRVPGKTNGNMKAVRFGGAKYGDDRREESRTKSGNDWNPQDSARNKRSVWTVATQSFSEAHFATFPEELIKPCILAGCPAGGTVLDPFGGSGTTGLVARAQNCKAILIELNPEYIEIMRRRLKQEVLEFDL